MGKSTKLAYGCSAFIIVPLAIIMSALYTDYLKRFGVYNYIDQYVDNNGNQPLMGIGPVLTNTNEFGVMLDDISDLTGKVILITGANSGLGKSTAFHLAGKGATVILGCRTITKAQATMKEIRTTYPDALLEALVLDLGSFQSIRAGADHFLARHNELHSLILNAAVGVKPFSLTEDGIEEQFGVNHVGHFLLTKLLLPVVEATSTVEKPATIVVVTSMAHFTSYGIGVHTSLNDINDESAYNSFLAYGQSKLANLLFAQELAVRVKNGVLVNSIHPGGVKTNLAKHIEASLRNSVPVPFKNYVANKFNDFLSLICWHPDIASLTILHASVGPNLIESKISGGYFHPIGRRNKPCAVHGGNTTLQHELWEFSEKLISN